MNNSDYGRDFTLDEIRDLLDSYKDPVKLEELRRKAFDIATQSVGNEVYYRGIVEFSNLCRLNCYYCGIRRENGGVERYTLTTDEIVDSALWCAENGYGSVVLQSGERGDPNFVEFVEEVIKRIKDESISDTLPQGLGITLSVGEQSLETYKRWFDAGAHRYLLRVETSNRELFASIHPKEQTLESRIRALEDLKTAGFQVGTGVMIGIPGQTTTMLAEDILFFKRMDVDMIGMGPFLTHPDSCLEYRDLLSQEDLLSLSLAMIATVRVVLPDLNIAATTALQAVVPDGRERGISFGANITMPNLTPRGVRKNYQLYSGKPCIEEQRSDCKGCLEAKVVKAGRRVGWNRWGDSLHALNKTE